MVLVILIVASSLAAFVSSTPDGNGNGANQIATPTPLPEPKINETPDPTPAPVTIPNGPPYLTIDTTFTSSEWENAKQLPMVLAGKDGKEQLGTAYLIYNPNTQTMYLAVQLVGSAIYTPQSDETWVSIDGIENKVAFSSGPFTAGNGFEATFPLQLKPGIPYSIIIHVVANYGGLTGETIATLKVGTSIFVVPEYFLGGLVALVACFAAFAAVKSKNFSFSKIHP